MRQAKEWYFAKHPNRGCLSVDEVRYWKTTLTRVLKIGMEFEYNLPPKIGTCRGNNMSCPCEMLTNDTCWQRCMLEETCKTVPSRHTCRNINDTCPKTCPKTCDRFEYTCLGTVCSAFTSICFECTSARKNCDSCEERYDPKKNPDAVRKYLNKNLRPTHNYGTVGPHGVHKITTDGSLKPDGGVEIITNGRRADYFEFYTMTKSIIDKVLERGGYVDERCSIHMHLLATYYDGVASELERSVPEIILANFHQLCRKFECPITWMTMALNDPSHMTRWEKFRVSVLNISPLTENMRTVKEEVKRAGHGRKYGWVNYLFTEFDPENDISKLHVEMRVMDGNNSPSAITAMAMLFYALLIKAIEISRYGVMKLSSQGDWFEMTTMAKDAMLNNNPSGWGENRLSNTKNLPKYYEFLRTESTEMLYQLKHILMKCGPAYDVLSKLAIMPPALRLCDGHTWKQIEDDLEVKIPPEDIFKLQLDKYVDVRAVYECSSIKEWMDEIAQVFKQEGTFSPDEVETNLHKHVDEMQKSGEFLWSATLGTMVKV